MDVFNYLHSFLRKFCGAVQFHLDFFILTDFTDLTGKRAASFQRTPAAFAVLKGDDMIVISDMAGSNLV